MDTVQQTVTLRDRQLALEEESLTLGIDRYQKDRERQDEADSGPGRRLINESITPLSEAITAFVVAARTGKGGKKHCAVRWVEKFPATEIAYITTRHCLNAISNSDTRLQSVAEAIATSLEDSINYSRFREVSPGLYKHLQGVLKKSTSQRHSRNVMEAATRRVELDQFCFPGNDGIHTGAALVDMFIESTGLAELFLDTSHGKDRRRTLLRGTATALDFLNNAHDAAAHFSPIRMPMLVPPTPWVTSKGGGYLTDAGRWCVPATSPTCASWVTWTCRLCISRSTQSSQRAGRSTRPFSLSCETRGTLAAVSPACPAVTSSSCRVSRRSIWTYIR